MADFPHILDALLGVPTLQDDGTEVTPRRATINFIGATIADNPDEDRVDVTLPGAAADAPALVGKLRSELRALINAATAGQTFSLKGVTTAGDGGGGEFVIVSGGSYTDDDGTVLVAGGFGASASKAAKRIYSGPLNVLWFGADPTGSVDSTTAIQRAIQAAAQDVYLPGGTYNIAASTELTTGAPTTDLFVALQMLDGVTLRGAGRDQTTLLVTTNRTGDHVDIAIWGDSISKCGVKDLTIDAGSQHGVDICLAFWATSFAVIENVKATRSEVHGLVLWYGSENNVIRDCYVYDVADIASPGIGFGIIVFGECHFNEISGCVVTNPTEKGLGGVYIDSSETLTDGGSCNYNVIRDCFVSNYQIGVGVEGSSYNLVSGCTVELWRQHGLLVNLSQDVIAPRKNNLVNNTIVDAAANNGESAIQLAGAFETTVSGNRIKTAGTNHGIRIVPPDGSSLVAAPERWEPSHGTYTSGDRVAGKAGTAGEFRLYTCITTGTGAVGGDGPTSTSSDITDGTAHWRYDITHPGVASRNTIVDNVLDVVTGSGILIETGKQTTIRGNRLTDCSGTPGTDAPIRVQNTSTSSIIDLPIDDVTIEGNKIYGGSASPGIYVITQGGTEAEGTITNVRTSHNAVRDIGAAEGILFYAGGAFLGPVSSSHDDIYDSRSTPEMTAAVSVGSAGELVTARIVAVQNRVPAVDDYTTSGNVIVIRDGMIPVSVTWDPGSLVAGASALKTDIAARGAQVGDAVMVSHPYDDGADGLLSIATVQEANYLRLTVVNLSGGTLATGSATWKFGVLRG